MVEWKKTSRRKATGGINNAVNANTKKLSDKGGLFSKTQVTAIDKRHQTKTRGGDHKVKISKVTTVLISQAGKTTKAKVVDVVDNHANKQFVRQKVVTKGAIIKVILNEKEHLAKVTSRPGQSGQVSAVLVK